MNQREIASSLGVSPSTVSYVLSGRAEEKRISPEMARQVRQAAKRANYRPHGFARSLLRQSTQQIGILLPNAADKPLTNPAVLEFVMGINLRLEMRGYVPVFVRVGDIDNVPNKTSRVFREHLIDGIIAIGEFAKPMVSRLKELSDKCIWLDASVYEDQRCLRRDELDAGRQVAQMAAEAGYSEVVIYALGQTRDHSQPLHYSSIDRERGIRQIAQTTGIHVHVVPYSRNFDRQTQEQIIPLLRPQVAWLIGGYFTHQCGRGAG